MNSTISHYIRAGYAGICLVTHEETRAEAIIRDIAKQLGFELHAWSCTTGLVNSEGQSVGDQESDALAVLNLFMDKNRVQEKSIVLLKDFHQFLGDGKDANPILTRKLKDAVTFGKATHRVLILIGCRLVLPPEIEKIITVVEFDLPGRELLRDTLEGIARENKLTLNGEKDAIIEAALGMTTDEAESTFALSLVKHKAILPEAIHREKAEAIRKNGLLEIVDSTSTANDIGGLEALKAWLALRKGAHSQAARDYGLPVPKGVLIVGIPGCGKSLTAKAASHILGVPLLKLDCGRLFGSLVGQSEGNMRSVIQTAEAVAPCVLWLDEIDKGFSGSASSGQTDGGTSARVLGSFLQWMNDKVAPVFVFATANSIAALPPEFLRKGRFDEIFFVDLPNEGERADIWIIQMRRKKRDPKIFSMRQLIEATTDFTGSEIEAVLDEALFTAFSQNTQPTTATLVEHAKRVVPLARTMKESLDALRRWASDRARHASAHAFTETVAKGRKVLTETV